MAVYHRLRNKPDPSSEPLIFLDFRPSYLKAQPLVYAALTAAECQICMYWMFKEMIATQHNRKHPPICKRCMVKVRMCPFCRIELRGASVHRHPRVRDDEASSIRNIARIWRSPVPAHISESPGLRTLAATAFQRRANAIRLQGRDEATAVRRRLVDAMQERGALRAGPDWPALAFLS